MKNTRYILSLIFLIIASAVVSTPVRAQMPIMYNIGVQTPPDSADVARHEEKHFLRAAGTVVGFNIGLWAFDRYVQNADYARINLHTIKRNLTSGFKWDNDNLGDNMFLHPYSGNLYFNAARSNGYNFWQSSLFAIGGSAMWELFMECEYPSTNDIIATPIGGTVLGEMTYRISDTMMDDRTTGAERAAREFGMFVVDPMRGFARLITGDMWKVRPTSGKQFGTPAVGIQISGGAKIMEYSHDGARDSKVGGTLGITMEYGDRFEVHSTKPYDYFTFNAQLNFITHQPILSRLNVQGRLLARELLDHHKDDLSIGLYQDFDYYDSDSVSTALRKIPFKLGVPASLGVGMMYRNRVTPRTVFDADLHLNAVLLGGVLTDYFNLDQRNYNLACGFSVKAGTQFTWDKEKFCVSANSSIFRLFTWKGYPPTTDLRKVNESTFNVMGDKSACTFAVVDISAQLRLWRKLYLGAQLTYFYRHTKYHDHPSVTSNVFIQSLQLIYKL
ncbi:MAG: DUF3943 domain-containing protein [Prevotella sp.]|nr:DUF3943 domain-containing protein [Prevotella sp.]MCM1074454.1 DUF3943 domain-containing protein [Ruminococcus sp.]